jgi:hypothetical protein
MSQNCVTSTVTVPGDQAGNLTPGTNYYITITANSSTTGISSATSAVYGPVLATVQLTTPTITVGYGVTAGSVSVTAGSSGGPANQVYTAKGCTNTAMTQGCTTNTAYTLGNDFTVNTNPAAGAAGVTYYVVITANSSPGYLASTTSAQASHADTGLMAAPVFTATSPANGTVKVTINAPTGTAPAPSSYTVEACTNQNMSGTCVTQTGFVSGSSITVPAPRRTTYYVEVTAIAPVGYVNNSSENNGTSVN